jgi:CheY-like chemotaxis protein
MTHILVIDNNPFSRMLLADTLRSSESGTTVVTAAHGFKSLDRYQEHRPDLVIAEIRLQELEGIDTILSFRELDRELPVLLTSRGLPVLLATRAAAVTTLDASSTTSSAALGCSLLNAVRACLAHPVAAPRENGTVHWSDAPR